MIASDASNVAAKVDACAFARYATEALEIAEAMAVAACACVVLTSVLERATRVA